MAKYVVVGTAGHIDHGKSSLVEALTGLHPDRLEEEKLRGITIDLGFASLSFSDGSQIGFVDVPGHERFIKNMLAGVGGIDAVLLVVAADESIKPQTKEHFDICRLLKVPAGLVAITKADLVDSELVELVKLEVQEFVKGSFLEHSPIIPVSARSRLGLLDLTEALRKLADGTPHRNSRAAFRLPIDRCFTLRGFGTVVTGTLLSGTLNKEDEVVIYPARLKTRVRGLQIHSRATDAAVAGQRTAVNLPNVEVSQIHRGMEISVPDRFSPVSTCDARIELLDCSPISIGRKTRMRLHHGTSEIVCALRPIGSHQIQPGTCGLVRIALDHPVLALPGDRFIVRQLSPAVTLGGGTILDIGRLKSRKISARDSIEWLESLRPLDLRELLYCYVKRSAFFGMTDSQILSQVILDKVAVREVVRSLIKEGRLRIISEEPFLVMESTSFAQLTDQVVSYLDVFHNKNPLSTGISKEQLSSGLGKTCHPLALKAALNQLAETKAVLIENELVSLSGRKVVLSWEESAAKAQIEDAFLQAGWKVPVLDEVLSAVTVPPDQARKLVILLAKEKRLVKISENLLYHAESIARLKELLTGYKKQSAQIDVGKFKDLTDISRKYAIPLLEFLDRERVTRRVGDCRIIL
jgi:selenocysteine-specific elongation factor